jgi:DEAD/DEAH box helicase domain-containing protein
LGDVQVVEKVVGYKKIKFETHENVGYGDVRLPDLELHTTSCWLTLGPRVVDALLEQGLGRSGVIDALRGLGHALEAVSAIALMCDARDIARSVEDEQAGPRDEDEGGAALFTPTLHLYDAYPGGIGLAPRIHEQLEVLVRRARGLIVGCGCQTGCPTCVGPSAMEVGALVSQGRTRKGNAQLLIDALGIGSVH